jgi:hypothetical protein
MTDLSRARRVPIALLGMLAAACGGERFSDNQGPSDAGPSDLRPVDEDSGVGGPTSTPVPDVPSPVLEASVVGGISVLPPGGLVTSEGGDQASFEVVLVDRPTADVTIGLESSDPGEGTISVDSLAFTRNDWDSPQTVVVTGQDDDEVDGHQGYTIVTLPAESNDPLYDGVDAADVAIANLDDDELGVRFEPASGLVTSETGQQAHVTARLSSRPSDDVAVFLGSSDTSEGVVTPAALTFTPNNWDSPKMVTVTGQDDEDPDGPVAYQLVITDIVSGDEEYAGLDTEAFHAEIENTDDDSAGVTVTGEDLVVSEGGETATFTVALNRAPTELVLIPVSSSDETEGTALPQLLSFTPDNWNAPQEVVVTGVDDDEADGDQEFVVQLDDALSSDSAYDGLDVPDVTVTNIDDESAGFTVQPGQVEVSESETSDTFEVRLTTQPSAQVVVGLSVNDPSEASLDTTELVFTESNWQTPQTVVVTGVDDDEVDGNQPFVVQTAPAQSEDDAYRGKNPPDVMGLTLDDETAGVTVTPTTGLVTSEDGTQAQFEVALLSAPTSRVHISLTSDDLGEGEVDPSELQFDADNWDIPQTVVVTGIDDATTDGAQPYTVITELETNDPAYSEVVVADVEVLNRDDECPVPELIDDFEDGDLVICPSVGRAGTWVAENTAAGEWLLETKSAGRGQSDFALFGSYAPDSSVDPVSGTDPFLAFPVLAVLLRAPEGNGSPQPFDASAGNGIRFWARATPGGTLSVALGTVDTWATGAAAQAQCLGGCTGHFTTTVQVDSTWQNYAIDFDSFAGSVAKGDAVFDPAKLLGLKFAIASDADAELWLDDVAFVQ